MSWEGLFSVISFVISFIILLFDDFLMFIIFCHVVMLLYFVINSIIKAIRYHENFFHNIINSIETSFSEQSSDSKDSKTISEPSKSKTISDYFFSFLTIIIPAIIISFSIGNLIYLSGTVVQIGNFFEADEFTAKYQANIKVIECGDLSKYNTLSNLDKNTVDVVVEKKKNTYEIKLIEYNNYVLINNSDENKYNRDEISKGFKFTPIEVYRNGKNCTPYDEYTGYYDKLPTYNVKLSNVLEKSLIGDNRDLYDITLVAYISFMCMLVIFLTWIAYDIKKSKLATIITFIISLIISTLLVVIPMKYTLPSVQNNVSKSYDLLTENSTLSYRNSYSSSRTYRDSDNENATSHTVKRNGAYLLNPDSMKIHTCYCHTIKHKENFIKTTDYEKAIEEGYEPCQVCKPEDEFNELLNLGISDAKKAEEKMNKFNEQTDKELEKRLKHIKKTNAKRVEKYRKLQQQAEEKMNKYNESLKQ